jgi:hypothetical protein
MLQQMLRYVMSLHYVPVIIICGVDIDGTHVVPMADEVKSNPHQTFPLIALS